MPCTFECRDCGEVREVTPQEGFRLAGDGPGAHVCKTLDNHGTVKSIHDRCDDWVGCDYPTSDEPCHTEDEGVEVESSANVPPKKNSKAQGRLSSEVGRSEA